MSPSAAVIGLVGVCVAAGAVAASAAAVTSPTARPCPSVTLVNTVLGTHSKAPVVVTTRFSKTCTYPGGRIGSTKIMFELNTLSAFLAGEKAAGSFGAKIVKVHGLGVAAWTTGLGDIYVFDGHEQIEVMALSLAFLSPSKATAKVEALVRKLL